VLRVRFKAGKLVDRVDTHAYWYVFLVPGLVTADHYAAALEASLTEETQALARRLCLPRPDVLNLKISGCISGWKARAMKRTREWRRNGNGTALRDVNQTSRLVIKPAPVDQAIDMLRLTSRASELFLQQSACEQRRLLQTVVEKASWKDGSLQTSLFEPFEILRYSNQESYRNEKEKAGSGRDMEIWLLR